MDFVDLCLCQRPLQTPVDESVAVRVPTLFRVVELVEQLHLLHDVAADGPDQIVEVVGGKIVLVG